MAKVDFVKLNPSDLERVVDLLQEVVNYKAKSLTRENWTVFETDYLPKVITAINDNSFKVVDPTNNIFSWLIDQAVHSKRVVNNLGKKDWIPLTDFERYQNTLTMLRAAARGHTSYHTHAISYTTFKTLFD